MLFQETSKNRIRVTNRCPPAMEGGIPPVGISKEEKSHDWSIHSCSEYYSKGNKATLCCSIICPWYVLGSVATLLQQEDVVDVAPAGSVREGRVPTIRLGPRGRKTCLTSFGLSILLCGCCCLYYPFSSLLTNLQRRQMIAKYNIEEENKNPLLGCLYLCLCYPFALSQQHALARSIHQAGLESGVQTEAPSTVEFIDYSSR